MFKGIVRVLLTGLLITGVSSALSAAPEATAREQIKTVLNQWPKDFAAKDAPAVCGLFAPDLVASYPGQPDRNYDAMCKHLTAALKDPNRTFRYDAPRIEEIRVAGDLAVVRLIWTLRVTDPKTRDELIVKERGIDVFTRQKDGSWKISISHAYPEPPAKKD